MILLQPQPNSLERSAGCPTRWSRNTKAPHLVKQRGALHTESGSCSFRTAEPPVRALAGCDNLSTYLFFKCRIKDLWLQPLVPLEWPWFKDAIVGKDDPARNVVLQLSDVTGPGVADETFSGRCRDALHRLSEVPGAS